MKTRKVVATLCAIALSFGFASSAFAGALPGTGITGSPHDLSTATGSAMVPGEVRLCAVCHTPHHGEDDANADYLPLWSRAAFLDSYIGYQSVTTEIDPGGTSGYGTVYSDPLRGPSRLCMSCHDGDVAIDAYYGSAGGAAGVATSDDLWGGWEIGELGYSFANLSGPGDGLSNDHPIGFDYESVVAADNGGDGELHPSTNTFDNGDAIADHLTLDPITLEEVMTCATCHDVHNTDNVATTVAAGDTYTGNYLLYGDQAGSSFCLTCHDK
ncbi:MAG: hypothetical protein C0622_11320 [Desulfuromonas sp.]|nr:MAG: hypothetical protein C0622_11320 [Desulfuromonas sp.]